MKLSELSANKNNRYLKLCLYGLSGAGKTVFASQAPGPIYFADFDGKISSAANYLETNNKDQLNQIEYDNFQPTSENGGVAVYHKFEKKLIQLEAMAKEGKFPFKTFVLDSLTSFSDMMIQAIIADNPSVKRVDKMTPALQDYLILNSHFRPMIYRMLALPCNVIVIAHLAQDKDETTGSIVYRPALSGKLPELLPILFEEVYHAYVDPSSGQRVAQTGSANRYIARTQISGMPNKIPLDYSAIQKVISGQIGAKK